MDNYTLVDTNGANDYQNSSERHVYRLDSTDNQLKLEATPNTITQTKFRLVITWDDNSSVQIDNKYVREVDLAYVIVNGTQKGV